MSEYIVSMQLGDPSGDGHGQSEVFTFKCNYSQDEIIRAYATAIAAGVPDIRTQAEEFEDSSLNETFVRQWLDLAATSMPKLNEMSQDVYAAGLFTDKNRGDPFGENTEDEEIAKQLSEQYNVDYDAREMYIDTDMFVKIYMFIVSTVLTDLEYKPAAQCSPIQLGGYGLFHG